MLCCADPRNNPHADSLGAALLMAVLLAVRRWHHHRDEKGLVDQLNLHRVYEREGVRPTASHTVSLAPCVFLCDFV